MTTTFDKMRIAFTTTFRQNLYKRWITDSVSLLFVPDDSSRSFRVFHYDCNDGQLLDCEIPEEHRPLVCTMPVQYFGMDKKLIRKEVAILPVIAETSPDRQRICWYGVDRDWVSAKTDLSELTHHSRLNDLENDFDKLWFSDESVLWFSDSRRWAEPFCSETCNSFIEVEVCEHGGAAFSTKEVFNLHHGTCVGTTLSGTSVVVSSTGRKLQLEPDETEVQYVSRMNLDDEAPSARRKKMVMPPGYTVSETCLAPASERLGWLLGRWDGQKRDQTVLMTDIFGKQIGPIFPIDYDFIQNLEGKTEKRDANCYDIEWLPDESGLSFICCGHVLSLAIG
ncbi:MAG: hypothetical protein ABJA67_00625 [Chthonomonadales bacterium]